MTAYSYTLLQNKSPWIPGEVVTVGAYFNIASTSGAAGVANNDTITASGLIPEGGVTILSVLVTGSEMDTNASPTGTFKVGDSVDSARFMSAATLGTNVATGQLVQYQNVAPTFSGSSQTKGVGFSYQTNENSTTYSGSGGSVDLVTTITASPATAATSGVTYLYVTYACTGIA